MMNRGIIIRASLLLNVIFVVYLAFSPLSNDIFTYHSSNCTHSNCLNDSSLVGINKIGNLIDTYKNKATSKSENAISPGGLQISLSTANEEKKSGDNSDVGLVEPPRNVQENLGNAGDDQNEQNEGNFIEEKPDPPLNSLEKKMYPDFRNCPTFQPKSRTSMSENHWFLENYVTAAMTFRCDESITYTTHSDYTFLDNLDPIASRWQGPVSVAIYAPGSDFQASLNAILYVRNCMADDVKKFVTFHIIIPFDHFPKGAIPTAEEVLKRNISCTKAPFVVDEETYKKNKKLLYPVNILRNLARRLATTYFNFPSDIELYPSPNIIRDFFEMLKRPDVSKTKNPRLFTLPIFEVEKDVSPPETKAQLQKLLKEKKAVTFHKYICQTCHDYPKSEEWMKAPPSTGLSVFHVGHRKGRYIAWEPIYIGTADELPYDERLSWEGMRDKMVQMYYLCVKEYEFHILDNAFLVHRPGIKRERKSKERMAIAKKQYAQVDHVILPQYQQLFGVKKGCKV